MRIEHIFSHIRKNAHAMDSVAKGAVIAVLLGGGVVAAQFVEPSGAPIGNDIGIMDTGGTDQAKTGELWAQSIATDNPGGQICLTDGTNCKTSWTSVHNLGTCRLETAQIISSGWMAGIDIGGQGCDQYTTPASQAAGWTSSGSNHSTVVSSSDGQPPQVWVVMRLVCAPGASVTVIPATSTVATSWPVANFTKSSNQCSDGIENEPNLSKATDPTAPAGIANDVEYSKDGKYLAVAHNTTPFISVYKTPSTGNPGYSKLSNPTGGLPAGNGQGIGFSFDSKYVAVAYASTPFVSVYRSDPGDVFTKITGPTSAPTGSSNSVAYSPDGKYMAVAHATSPFVTIYKRSGANGETYTKLSNPATLPTGIGRGVTFSVSGKYMIVAHDTTPFVTVYKISAGDVFTKIANPATLPTGNGVSVESDWGTDLYGATTDSFYVAHAVTPYITNCSLTNPDASDIPNADDGVSCGSYITVQAGVPGAITSKGGVAVYTTTASLASKVFTVSDGTPFLTIYGLTLGAGKSPTQQWVKDANPSPLPTASNAISAAPNGKSVAVAFGTTPFLYIYQYKDGLIDYPNDPQCGSWWDNTEATVEATVACSDSLDNDSDGRVDYAADASGDSGCINAADTTE